MVKAKKGDISKGDKKLILLVTAALILITAGILVSSYLGIGKRQPVLRQPVVRTETRSTPVDSEQDPRNNSWLYTKNEFGFSVVIPSKWWVSKYEFKNGIVIYPPNGNANVKIVREDKDLVMDLKHYVTLSKEGIRKDLPIKIISEEFFNNSVGEGYMAVLTLGGSKLKKIIFFANNRIYLLFFTAPKNEYQNFKESFDVIEKSFTVKVQTLDQ